MSEIHIHRDHSLGLARARKVALKWAEHVEKKFDMACTILEGDTSDTVEFTRSGVNGRMVVTGEHFELQAKLGFLLGAFAGQIENEVRTAYSNFIEAQQVLESQLKVIEQAEEAVRLAMARNDAGSGTQLDVLSAQTALTDSRTTQAVALRDYAVALARLERAIGEGTRLTAAN